MQRRNYETAVKLLLSFKVPSIESPEKIFGMDFLGLAIPDGSRRMGFFSTFEVLPFLHPLTDFNLMAHESWVINLKGHNK